MSFYINQGIVDKVKELYETSTGKAKKEWHRLLQYLRKPYGKYFTLLDDSIWDEIMGLFEINPIYKEEIRSDKEGLDTTRHATNFNDLWFYQKSDSNGQIKSRYLHFKGSRK